MEGPRTPDQLYPDELELLNRFLADATHGDTSLLDGLTPHELETFLELLRALRDGEGLPIGGLWQLDYISKPVDPYTFLTDEHYYGKRFQYLYEGWVPELTHVLDPKNRIREWILTGGVGVGKTTVAVLAEAYKTYLLSLLRNPQIFYGLEPDSMICIGLFNTTLDKTDLTLHYKFENLLVSIPYFRDRFPVVPRRGKKIEDYTIELPKHIRLISGSNAMHALSLDLYGGILDEQNFREGQQIQPYKESKAYDLYNQTLTRIQSRFRDEAPCLLINISSARTMTDFLAEHIELKKVERDEDGKVIHGDVRTHVSRFALWDIKRSRYKGQKRFYVSVGDQYNPSRILSSDDHVPESRAVVSVPEEHRQNFVDDIERSLRDLAGVDGVVSGNLLPDRSKLQEAIAWGESLGLVHPFSLPEVTLSIADDLTLQDIFLPEALFEWVGRTMRFKRHPESPRYIHVDLAVNACSAAISCGHCATTGSVTNLPSHKKVEIFDPILEMDFILRINPPPLSQIDFGKIADFIVWLRKTYSVKFDRVSYDGFQSTHSIQILKKNGFDGPTEKTAIAKVVSIDRDDKPYVSLRQAIMEHRFATYDSPVFADELGNLIHDMKKGKVQHQRGAKKDVADSVAGVSFACYQLGRTPRLGQTPLPPSLIRTAPPRRNSPSTANWVIGDYKRPEDKTLTEIVGRPH